MDIGGATQGDVTGRDREAVPYRPFGRTQTIDGDYAPTIDEAPFPKIDGNRVPTIESASSNSAATLSPTSVEIAARSGASARLPPLGPFPVDPPSVAGAR
jgi:hypothetical protein